MKGLLMLATTIVAQAALAGATYKGPRSVDGKPDLQGVWNYSSDVPLERPKEYADRTLMTREERAKQNAAHIHDARIIPLDGRPHIDSRIRSWNGDSLGRWAGETLVVETTNFSPLTQSFNDCGTGASKVVTERFTRVSDTTLEYEATIVDPDTYQDRIVLSFPMPRSTARVFEFACHEHNYSLPMILSGARAAEETAAPRR